MSARVHATTVRRLCIRLVSLCAGLALLGGTAAAQDEQPIEVDIEAQDLSSALTAFGRQTKTEIAFTPDVVDSKQAPAVKGEMTRVEVLETLLADTSLEYHYADNGTVIVRTAALPDEERPGVPGTARTAPTVMAQALPTELDTTGDIGNRSAGVVIGKVSDFRTGTNLKGALVTIEESGQTTRTDNLGGYRFSNLPAGAYTIRVSFLGFSDNSLSIQVVAKETLQLDFRLTALLEEIMVFGTRSARAQALNLERSAPNSSTVLSSDLLGNFNGQTISEALRRAPGVAFAPNADTGDGDNIIIRGLEPDLNQVTLNGFRLPEVTGNGRSPALSNILTDSIESVTISKTLLPSQDSTAAGGLVDIETKSPLDRDSRFTSFSAQYGSRRNGFEKDLQLGGTVSGVFGASEDLGASLSVQYRNRDVDRIAYTNLLAFGQYLPLGIDGSPVDLDSIPADTMFPFEPGVDLAYPLSVQSGLQSTRDDNLTITASFQKLLGSHTDLRFDFTRIELDTETLSTNQTSSTLSGYELLPVDELGGEERFALNSVLFGIDSLFRASSSIRGSAVRGQKSETNVIGLRGTTRVDAWTFDYSMGYSKGSRDTPQVISFGGDFDRSAIAPVVPEQFVDAVRNNTVGGRIVSPFLPVRSGQELNFILPAFTSQELARRNNIDEYSFGIGTTSVFGENSRETVSASIRRNFDGRFFRYVEVGADFESARFSSFNGNTRSNAVLAADVTPSEIGLSFTTTPLGRLGFPDSGLGIFAEQGIVSVLGRLDELASGQAPPLILTERTRNPDLQNEFTQESELSLYLEAHVDIGKLELIGGVRVNAVDIDTAFLTRPRIFSENSVDDPNYADQFEEIIEARESLTDTLPRVLVNYRLSEDIVFRGGYFASVSRPTISQLNGTQSVTYVDTDGSGPETNPPLVSIFQSNPELKPAFTHSFDLSWEWYTGDVGVVEVSAFYKTIENAFQATSTEGGLEILPEDLVLPRAPEFDDLSNAEIVVSQPVNGDNNPELWGIEVAAERQLLILPGAWSGIGLYGNFTYTDSKRDATIPSAGEDLTVEVPFEGEAGTSYTVGLTYNKYGIDASIYYSYQDRRLGNVDRFGLSSYAEELDSLDFQLAYRLPLNSIDARIFFSGLDLLRDSDQPYLQTSVGGEDGVPKYFTSGSYFGGRTLTVGIGGNF